MFQHSSKTRFKHCLAALACLLPGLALAQGSEPYLGQILYVGFNFTPVDWNQCDGTLLAISQNDALFAVIGTTYGGDGVNTFQLPDMRSRMPIHQGSNGSANYIIGERSGAETHTLLISQMPAHTHIVNFSAPIQGSSGVATSAVPAGHSLGNTGRNLDYASSAPDVSLGGTVTLSGTATGSTGGGQPLPIMQPYLAVNCIVALYGVFPTQN